ncbi:MAG TPA: hypothetical protein VN579_07740 [Bryobacteraceae bacterium]|nr:hypothetical protein [Bryobacteraceae bacterium]
MNKLDQENRKPENGENEEPSKGPNLVLMYSLIALAMLVATAIAAMIVLPFYLRR